MIDIKAIREAALDAETDGHTGSVVFALCEEIERRRLPDDWYPGSKDWREAPGDRGLWLRTMYEQAKEEIERLQKEVERLRTALEQPAQKTCGRCVVFCQGGEGCHCNAPQISQRKRDRLVSDQLNRNPAVEPYDHGPQAETVAEALRDVSKWLNERPNRPLDLRHVAMLCAALAEPAPVQEQQPVAWASQTAIDIAAEGGEGIIVGAEADCLIPLYAVPQPAPAERTVQEPVCRGCGIPANDLHMSTCPTKKWPMRVTPADAAQPALVQEPVAWWKQYPDGNVSVVGGKVFLTEDALYRGWRPLGFADAAPADVPLKPNGVEE